MEIKEVLRELSIQNGMAGQEGGAAEKIAELLDGFGQISFTPLGSVICRVREPQPGQPDLLLDAHMDEIGLIVTHIEDSGFLRVDSCGGVDRRVLPACQVTVHGRDGPVCGVIANTPPHLSSGEKKFPKPDELYLDIGYTKDEAEKRVRPGDRVSLPAAFRGLLGDRVSGKALDNRAGCAAILHAARLLREAELNCGLSLLFSSMEEIGGQGAKTAAHAISPTHAIVVDTSFALTPGSEKTECGEMGKGPMIGISPILSSRMSDRLVKIAKDADIPYQFEVMSGQTSTNADSIAATRAGVITGLISIPIRYMHTPVETLSFADLEAAGNLLAAFVKDFGKGGQTA
ncbi:MAG: M20/M25/M40 family metallo-hydrolase [Oscillospiraceae bacterium]|nr:M20/M25/M40 family metallo-hydrolase [Oscillospiraceae bacterium]